MFDWLERKIQEINPPDMLEVVKQYLKENAPDILEKYKLNYFPSEILNSRIEFENKFYYKYKHWEQDNTFGFRMRDNCGDIVSEYNIDDAKGTFTKTIGNLIAFDTEIKENKKLALDTLIDRLRKIDSEIKACFAEARPYFELLNEGLYGKNFTINCYEGKILSISVVPGNFNKFFEYVKPQLKENEVKEYEEYCYQRFKSNENKAEIDAFGPTVSMDLPSVWRKTLPNSENSDPEYIAANEACKDVINRIKNTVLIKED